MKSQMKKLIPLLALIVIWASPVWAQGPVVLMGIDAEDGGPGAHGPITVYEDVVQHILNQATNLNNAGSGILVIGGGKNPADHVTTFWEQIAADLPVAVTYVNGNANIGMQPFGGFKMIAVVSSSSATPSGGLTQDENNALATRNADIADFVNNQHGGLLGFTQIGFTNRYAYLGDIGAFSFNFPPQYSDITPTTEGMTFGITDALDVCCWHDEYITFPGFLEILATNAATGDPAAIGGNDVIIEQMTFEYAAKIVCGTQKESNNLRLAKGIYATVINIHNPNDTTVVFLKKLALTYPPEEQRPGRVDTLGFDKLGPDQALKTDCIDIERKLPNGFPTPYIEGFVIIKGPASLDVSAVYTAAKLHSFLSPQRVTSIDVEQIRERKTSETPPTPPDKEEPKELGHFKVYEVEQLLWDFQVRLTDQFDTAPKEANLDTLTHFANPTSKVLPTGAKSSIKDTNRHLNWYTIRQEQPEPRRTIRFINQFGQHSVVIRNPRYLLVPAQKTLVEGSVFPDSLDHYKCYEVIRVNLAPNLPVVTLEDQFGSEQNVQVRQPRYFCLPVRKQREGKPPHNIMNAKDHLTIYDIPPRPIQREIEVLDQFEGQPLFVIRSVMLAVPTEKQAVVAHRN